MRPSFFLVFLGCLALTSSLRGEEASGASFELGAGWDSLYMFRGVNQLPGFEGYGSSLSWTSVSVAWAVTAKDTLTLGTWQAFGLGESDYKEFDVTAAWTHAWNGFDFTLGYALYAVLSAPNGLYAHELNAAAAYGLQAGPVSLTPVVLYAFNLGPAPGNRGYVEQASSYLELRLDAETPRWRDAVSFAPWIAAGFNFRSNTTDATDPAAPFTGFNHVEVGVALPLRLGPAAALSPYVAGSFSGQSLAGTAAATFWGGVNVVVGF